MRIEEDPLVPRNEERILARRTMESVPGDAANVVRLFVTCDAIDRDVLDVLNVHYSLQVLNVSKAKAHRYSRIREQSRVATAVVTICDHAVADQNARTFLATNWALAWSRA